MDYSSGGTNISPYVKISTMQMKDTNQLTELNYFLTELFQTMFLPLPQMHTLPHPLFTWLTPKNPSFLRLGINFSRKPPLSACYSLPRLTLTSILHTHFPILRLISLNGNHQFCNQKFYKVRPYVLVLLQPQCISTGCLNKHMLPQSSLPTVSPSW